MVKVDSWIFEEGSSNDDIGIGKAVERRVSDGLCVGT